MSTPIQTGPERGLVSAAPTGSAPDPAPSRAPWRPLLLWGVLVASLGAAVAWPSVAFALALGHLAAAVVIAGVQWLAVAGATGRGRPAFAMRPAWGREPFLSVLVPVRDASPAVLDRCLAALAELDHPTFEVLVLAYDGADPKLRRGLGRRFRFLRVDTPSRATALERGRRLADVRTELILVVDGDCVVEPDLVERAWKYFDCDEVSHVQFRRGYTGGGGASRGIVAEETRTRELLLTWADHKDLPLPAGALCLVRRDALDQAGGWRPAEDELGLRLHVEGFRGRYAPELGGTSLLPGDLSALRGQRRRWIRSHVRALLSLRAWRLRRLGLRGTVVALGQLTAWIDPILVPALLLVLLAFRRGPFVDAAAGLAAVGVLGWLLHSAVFLALRPGRPRHPLRSLLARLGLLWDGASAWLPTLLGLPSGPPRSTLPPLLAFAALALGALLHGLEGRPLVAVACGAGALSFLCVLHLRGALARAARATPAAWPDDLSVAS